jgi:hypothetical protein
MMKIAKIASMALALTLSAAFTLPDFTPAFADTQTQTVKKKKKQTSQGVKKNYQATPPGQPNQAGMTDDCSYWYNVYGRMPVGCDKYGRSFRLGDN